MRIWSTTLGLYLNYSTACAASLSKKAIKMASTQFVVVSRFVPCTVLDDHRLNDAPRGGHGNIEENPASKSPDRVKGKHLKDR